MIAMKGLDNESHQKLSSVVNLYVYPSSCHFLAVMLMLQGIAHDVIQLPLNMQALIDKDQGCQL
jgi:hypothetical protein